MPEIREQQCLAVPFYAYNREFRGDGHALGHI